MIYGFCDEPPCTCDYRIFWDGGREERVDDPYCPFHHPELDPKED